MSKQTALQWFLDKLPHSIETQFSKQIQEALQMEREQIIDAYVECYMNHVGNGESILREANSYYKNTYGGQDE
jgi:hypothetical protein